MCDYYEENAGYVTELEEALEIANDNYKNLKKEANASDDRVRFLNEANRALSSECRDLMTELGKAQTNVRDLSLQLKTERKLYEDSTMRSKANYDEMRRLQKLVDEQIEEIDSLVDEKENFRAEVIALNGHAATLNQRINTLATEARKDRFKAENRDRENRRLKRKLDAATSIIEDRVNADRAMVEFLSDDGDDDED